VVERKLVPAYVQFRNIALNHAMLILGQKSFTEIKETEVYMERKPCYTWIIKTGSDDEDDEDGIIIIIIIIIINVVYMRVCSTA
jgi:hypothetical protein